MKFFKKNASMQQSEVKQPRRFTLGQYIAAVSVMLVSVTALSYAAGILTLHKFDAQTVISAQAVNENFTYVQDNLTAIAASMVSAANDVQASNSTINASISASASSVASINTKLLTLNTIKLNPAFATTSGTSIDITNIPAGVKRIKLSFMGVSLSGAADFLIQIGDAYTLESSGYDSISIIHSLTSRVSTAGFIAMSGNPAAVSTGIVYLDLGDTATNTWILTGTTVFANNTAQYVMQHIGNRGLSGVLTKLRLTTTTGTDTFDLGKVSIAWEF